MNTCLLPAAPTDVVAWLPTLVMPQVEPRPVSSRGPAAADACRALIVGREPWQRCMLHPLHDGACLPVPPGRGLAVR